jgi:hypothetical protein
MLTRFSTAFGQLEQSGIGWTWQRGRVAGHCRALRCLRVASTMKEFLMAVSGFARGQASPIIRSRAQNERRPTTRPWGNEREREMTRNSQPACDVRTKGLLGGAD